MKIKLILLGLFALLIAGASFARSQDSMGSTENITLTGDITLTGEDPGEGGQGVKPRALSVSTVSATLLDKTTIEITYLYNYGSIEVNVTDDMGTVYITNTINTSQTNKQSIDVSVLESGSYKISIKDTAGNLSKSGTFEIY